RPGHPARHAALRAGAAGLSAGDPLPAARGALRRERGLPAGRGPHQGAHLGFAVAADRPVAGAAHAVRGARAAADRPDHLSHRHLRHPHVDVAGADHHPVAGADRLRRDRRILLAGHPVRRRALPPRGHGHPGAGPCRGRAVAMSEDQRQIPAPPTLGPAAEHRAAAEQAAARRDYDRALRERFRAVLRGMEQRGLLETRRSRTADETAADASTVLAPEAAAQLDPAARSFDEVVYGGRPATEDEYRRLEYADAYSAAAPPPKPEPLVREVAEAAPRPRRRALPPLPALLRDPRFWAGLAGLIVLGLLLYAAMQSCAAPSAPPPPDLPPPSIPDPPDDPDLPPIEGRDSIFDSLPAPLAFGGLMLLITSALLVW